MRRITLLTAISLLTNTSIFSQSTSNYAYVITSPGNSKLVGWTEVKMVDLATGKLIQNIFESKNNNFTVLDARSNKLLNAPTPLKGDAPVPPTSTIREPFDTYCAAAAYDAKHKRLYYTPMGINQLRYIEPQTNKIYYFNNEAFGVAKDLSDLANHITRMTFDPNGIGYALSNDANHLISFTTDKKPVITDLGSLSDAPTNKDVSIHAQVPSWGGDMVADKFGNLYLISAKQALFKINIQSKEAKFIGYISGFPENFTTNGAAVNDEGNMIVSSAASTAGYYVVDISEMCAKKYSQCDSVFIGSDLANENFLFDNKTQKPLAFAANTSKVLVYPNPVLNGVVHTNFNSLPAGLYTIQLLDQSGKLLTQKNVNVRFTGQLEDLDFRNKLSKGTYILKVSSLKNKSDVFVSKIVAQ